MKFWWRPEADVGQDPKSSDLTAAQPGKWHRANTQDKADQETFTQSVHATVSHNTCINKEKLKDDLGEVSIDSHRLDEVGGEGVVKVAEHEAGALDRHTALVRPELPAKFQCSNIVCLFVC